MTWHAFNWDGEYETAPTKAQLMASVAPSTRRGKKLFAGVWQIKNGPRTWWLYRDLQEALDDGFSLPKQPRIETAGVRSGLEPAPDFSANGDQAMNQPTADHAVYQTATKADWPEILEDAVLMLDAGLWSALKQAASDHGIAYGTQEMSDFVTWGERELCGN